MSGYYAKTETFSPRKKPIAEIVFCYGLSIFQLLTNCTGHLAAEAVQLRHRKRKREGRSFALGALDTNLTTMLLDNGTAYIEAQAGPRVRLLLCTMTVVEALPDVFQLLRRDS